MAEELLKTEYDAVRLVYNRFVSAIAFKPTIATILSPDVSPGHSAKGCFLGRALSAGPMPPQTF